jgi:hypothetical protein
MSILQIPWTRQPQTAVRLASNFATEGLDVLFSLRDFSNGLVQGPTLTPGGGGPTESAAGFGIGQTFGNATARRLDLANFRHLSDGTAYALLIVFQGNGAGDRQLFTQDGGSGANRINQFRIEASGAVGFITFNTSGSTFGLTGGSAAFGVHCALATVDASGGVALYVDGAQVATTTYTGTIRSPSTAAIAPTVGNRSGVSSSYNGIIGLVGQYGGRTFSRSEGEAITADPWGLLFARRKRQIWVEAPGGEPIILPGVNTLIRNNRSYGYRSGSRQIL